MTNTRKSQIRTLAILLLAIIGLTIGFAAFTSSLRIKTRLSVNPNKGTFNVKFSKVSNELVEDNVIPTKSSDIFEAFPGIIDNSGIPTISDLGGEFTQPGESITYEFYALNTGEYKAYLTDVIFGNVDGENVNKVCTSLDGTHQSEVDVACNDISIKVIIGQDILTTSRSNLVGHELNPNASEKVKVEITYASGGILPEVPFEVTFGDISMVYNNLEGESTTSEPIPQQSNPWYTRNPNLENIVFDKMYVTDTSLSPVWNEFSYYSNGGGLFGREFTSEEMQTEIFDSGAILDMGSNYFVMQVSQDYCVAVEFHSNNTAEYYRAPIGNCSSFSSVKTYSTSIVRNSYAHMGYILEDETNPWLTRGIISPNVVYDSEYVGCLTLNSDGSVDINNDTITSSELDNMIENNYAKGGTNYMVTPYGAESVAGYVADGYGTITRYVAPLSVGMNIDDIIANTTAGNTTVCTVSN